jgi:hypothetical protein
VSQSPDWLPERAGSSALLANLRSAWKHAQSHGGMVPEQATVPRLPAATGNNEACPRESPAATIRRFNLLRDAAGRVEVDLHLQNILGASWKTITFITS